MVRVGAAVAILSVILAACSSSNGGAGDAGVSDAGADAGCVIEIQASSYEQTCTKDSDCVDVNVGNACAAMAFICGANLGAINATRAPPTREATRARTPTRISSA
jgi:hypothetical protein